VWSVVVTLYTQPTIRFGNNETSFWSINLFGQQIYRELGLPGLRR
jgi:hypothetical protein